jgi:hypothetical protein
MTDWWSDLDTAVLECLKDAGPTGPGEVAERLGMSETAATSLLCMLAKQRKVRICLVEHMEARQTEPASHIDRPSIDSLVTAG